MRRNFCAQKGNITAQSCQNVTMLDTIMLNLDRHDGNLLLGKNGSGLIPIDHGLSFPSTETVRQDQLITNMAGEKNVLLRLPGSYEPFTQESLAGIAELDPDLMTSALMAENVKMAQAHPGTEGTVSTESLTISNLSTKFLKKAAPTLPPAVLQIALAVHSRKLLDPGFGRDPQAWDQFAGQVIAEYAPKVAPLKEFWMLPGDEQEAIFRKLNDDGILNNFRPDYAWIAQNIELVLPYCQAGITPTPPRPTPPQPQPVDATQTRLEVAEAVPGLKLDRKKEDEWVADWQKIRVLGGIPVVQQALLHPNAPRKYKTVADVLAQVRLYLADAEKNDRAGKLVAIHQVFPDLPLPEDKSKVTKLLASWDAFMRNGGAQALRQAQQLRPNLPAPRDVDAALLMILAPPANPAQAALKGLDYLDRVVVADPAVVSQQDQTSIQQMRIDITGNQLQGDPKAAVTQLTDRVLAAAVPLVKARFEALERRMPENDWEQIETLWFTSLQSGKLMDAIGYLQQLEASLPAQPIR